MNSRIEPKTMKCLDLKTQRAESLPKSFKRKKSKKQKQFLECTDENITKVQLKIEQMKKICLKMQQIRLA